METPSRIEVEAGTRIVLTWEDGSETTISAGDLRAGCLCADCRSEEGARRKQAMLSRPDDIRVESAALVGDYAINFRFSPDAHGTGIFSFDHLRELGTDE